MYVQKEKADLIGRHKIKKIEDRYNHIISNNDTAENCFRALIKSSMCSYLLFVLDDFNLQI